MKKSQRLRLAALTAQATRTEAEATELAQLQALAATHTDPAADLADAPAAPAPAATVIAPDRSTLRGFVASLVSGAQTGTALVTAQRDLATRTTERDTARASVATLTEQVTAFAAFFGLTPTELAGKKSADVTALITQKISDHAVDLVAGTGVPLGKVPAASEAGDTGSTLAEIQAELATCKDPVRAGVLAAQAKALREKQSGGKN